MTIFRLFLATLFTIIVVYTVFVGLEHGWNLFPLFFSDIFAMTWAGQFNLDFLGFLSLSALWVAWRHHFSAAGLGLSILAFTGGIPFLSVYLLYASLKADGDMKVVFLGPERAKAA
ncbi:MAG: hypothetical protein JJ939_02725 [Alphaproteobacteria bacterium]|jgi:hypothetical protein|nr:hypothetical protein [Alphaproteobacteria bacterium]MBO6627317.1 hypothetical protein [Alphaproteobacteria bacterium]MDF1626504.1 hypothetical protein [Parvibaculaceae bacterium]|tara:strand:+ start:357 stop:704 length:348 start_codon:yes stop_codon:yes gene_type:complete